MLMSSAQISSEPATVQRFAIQSMVMLDEKTAQSIASDTMCMFMAVNMSMIQIVPVTIIKIRSGAGSTNPGSIIIPSILAGLVSMVASIWVCKYYERKRRK